MSQAELSFRRIALPNAVESAHMGSPAFRARGLGTLKLTPRSNTTSSPISPAPPSPHPAAGAAWA